MPLANNLQTATEFLDESKAGFIVEPVTLARMPSWTLADGALSHVSGGFFSVIGAEFDPSSDRSRQALFLYQPQSAINGLLTCVREGRRHFLLQARAEPGNLGGAQYGPTLQSTPANYLRMHGGKASPYLEFFTRLRPDLRVLHDSVQLDLGGRYLFKSKRVIVVECPADVPVEDGFIWVAPDVITESVACSTFLNTDLRALLAVWAWEFEGGEGELSPACRHVAASMRLPPRAPVLGRVMESLGAGIAAYRLVDLARLQDWRITDRGIVGQAAQCGIDVGYFHVEARRREVSSWQQPLIVSRTSGHARLVCRLMDGVLEVLVTVEAEAGLQTGKAVLPSQLRYPGAAPADSEPCGRVLLQTTESDEGGRFYRNASTCELVLAEPGYESAGVWLRVSELKWLLARSNVCAIQLRCLASFLLGELAL
ncbi:MAG TPA: NDP-hexose 2,3-dehydratase family protein [Ramlibacter sp.]|nr:NDP-hexose 2,3-dehydratase family protein [Ramlibacter sp.]